MSNMQMVDNEDQRDDRKLMPAVNQRTQYHIPPRRERRKIFKRRGGFKKSTPGNWHDVNKKISEQTQGDQSHEDTN